MRLFGEMGTVDLLANVRHASRQLAPPKDLVFSKAYDSILKQDNPEEALESEPLSSKWSEVVNTGSWTRARKLA